MVYRKVIRISDQYFILLSLINHFTYFTTIGTKLVYSIAGLPTETMGILASRRVPSWVNRSSLGSSEGGLPRRRRPMAVLRAKFWPLDW